MPKRPDVDTMDRISRKLTDDDRRILKEIHHAEPYKRCTDIIHEGIRHVRRRQIEELNR